MDAQEFRSLQEAYLEVVMNEGKKPFPFGKVSNKIKSKTDNQKKLSTDVDSGNISPKEAIPKSDKLVKQRYTMGFVSGREREKKEKEDNLKRSPTFYRKDKHLSKMTKTQREDYDLYDIILSHLLDEGYAETPESAEVIMVNMSEEWRQSIVEEVLDEELTGARKQTASDMLDRKLRDVETLRKLSARKRQKPEDLGSGNKARRRAGKEVKDSTLGISDD
jgi:hypothetical protein